MGCDAGAVGVRLVGWFNVGRVSLGASPRSKLCGTHLRLTCHVAKYIYIYTVNPAAGQYMELVTPASDMNIIDLINLIGGLRIGPIKEGWSDSPEPKHKSTEIPLGSFNHSKKSMM